MTKRIKRILSACAFIAILSNGIVASAGSVTTSGNKVSWRAFYYGMSWTGTSGSRYTSTSWYAYSLSAKQNYCAGYAYSNGTWAQTETKACVYAHPVYSLHSCDSYTTYRDM